MTNPSVLRILERKKKDLFGQQN